MIENNDFMKRAWVETHSGSYSFRVIYVFFNEENKGGINMTGSEILTDAREHYKNKIREIYELTGSALWTPDTHKIWDYISRIVALTYHDQEKYSAKLSDITELDIDGANKLAMDLIGVILPILEERETQ